MLGCVEQSKFYGNLIESYNDFKSKHYFTGIDQMVASLLELPDAI